MFITRKQISILISWTAVIVWMALIFYFSSQVADQSNNLSTGITQIIVQFIENVTKGLNFDVESFNHIVRKNAHFLVYLILGILTLNALRKSGIQGYRSVFLALTICILYAISDEVHQLFVPGRVGQIRDVIIDSVGASVGIVLVNTQNDA